MFEDEDFYIPIRKPLTEVKIEEWPPADDEDMKYLRKTLEEAIERSLDKKNATVA